MSTREDDLPLLDGAPHKREKCSKCGEYNEVGKYDGKSQPICRVCLDYDSRNPYEEFPEHKRRMRKKQNPVVKYAEIPKRHRNDPCPCGSGKKFKKCCIKIYNR